MGDHTSWIGGEEADALNEVLRALGIDTDAHELPALVGANAYFRFYHYFDTKYGAANSPEEWLIEIVNFCDDSDAAYMRTLLNDNQDTPQ